jgi:hypothetical protein
MSRYPIPTPSPYAFGVVGYDPPLGTFFAQLWAPRGAQSEVQVVRWVGTDIQEIDTVDALAAAIADVTTIPTEIQEHLVREQQSLGFRPNFGTRLLQQLQARSKEWDL